VFSNKINQQIQVMTFDEELRQQELATEKITADEQRRQNIQYALLAFGIISFYHPLFITQPQFYYQYKTY
jgi:hypothetical protein